MKILERHRTQHDATMTVLTALTITNVSNLVFNDAEPGATSEVIAPDLLKTRTMLAFTVFWRHPQHTQLLYLVMVQSS